MSPLAISRTNNFDLIRLFAALQVVVWHLRDFLGLTAPAKSFFYVLRYFPGVPIFFILSGFLIFSSFDRNKDVKQYFKNRVLRIFPALWVAFIVLFGVLFYFGYEARSTAELIKWSVAQLTFFQQYTPQSIYAYMDNNPNPSLWTIRVELGFYILVPVFFWIIRKIKFISMTSLMIILMILSFGLYYYLQSIKNQNTSLYDLFKDDVFCYLFYFLFGVLSYLHFDKLKKLYEGKGLYWLALYVIYVVVLSVYLDLYESGYAVNLYSLIGVFILSQTVISMAFTRPHLSGDLLKGKDISYGIYLYHVIIIGIFFQNGYYANNKAFTPILLLTIAIAYLSWILVEKPALTLKNAQWPAVVPFGLGLFIMRSIKKVF
jgi:peptidoglycan/LPS O-acetylase OafA/YrhL